MNKIIGMYSLTKLANNLQIWQNLFNKYSDKYKINIYCGKIDTACDIAHINDCYMLRDIDKKFIGNRLLQIHTHPNFGIKKCVKTEAVKYASNNNIPIIINAGHFARGNLPYITNKYIPLLYWFGLDIYDSNIIKYLQNSITTNKLIISFAGVATPSKVGNSYHNKGTNIIVNVLNKLKLKYPNKFDFILISGQTHDECLRLKSLSHIVIDDINSGNYNQNGFEGLALGKVVIGKISLDNQILFNTLSQSNNPIPYINIDNSSDLLNYIERHILNNTIDSLIESGASNRLWMEHHWNPEILINERINLYTRLLDNDSQYYTNIVEKINFNTNTGGLIKTI